MNVLEVTDVKKRLGKREIIKGISFQVKEGEIFGFLGPNGAGKTTTIRMLTGLIHPNSGTIKIMGHDIMKDTPNALSNVGAVVENPELYTYLSGLENLMQIGRIRKVSKAQIMETVELVGLTDRINDKVKKYSLGMKQRLGLAASLLSKPKLLILDEPTNGLDPTGIMDFRDIVKKASKEYNCAVFISSHILNEVQQLCDRVAFINEGIIQSVESLTSGSIKTSAITMSINTLENELLEKTLKDITFVEGYENNEGEFLVRLPENMVSELIFKLSEKRVPLKEFSRKHQELEERYMELVEGGKRL